jgi:hypothetical protein
MAWWRGGRAKAEPEATGAEINRLASELQVFVGGKGITTGHAVTVFATALANEAAAAVMRNPGLTIDEMLDMTCETVREMARYTAKPSSDVPKEPGDLTEQEFAQLTMRLVHIATNDTTATDAMTATAKALGLLIATFARRPNVASFDEILRYGQNGRIAFARQARADLERNARQWPGALVLDYPLRTPRRPQPIERPCSDARRPHRGFCKELAAEVLTH